MATLGKSRFGRDRLLQRTSNIAPMRVEKRFPKSWDDISEQVMDTDVATTWEGDGRKLRRLASRSERLLATRMNELSQLESPLLRELAQRLSVMLQVEKPICFEKFDHPYTNLHVGDRWEEIQGCNDWHGLLEPDFNPVLKGEILRYGEFAQATYDAFDRDKRSKHYGTCKYTKKNLLEQVGLENRGYEITNFLYATTNLQFPNFLAWNTDIDGEGNSQKVDENGTECDVESSYDVGHHGDHSHILTDTDSEEHSSEQSRATIQNWECKHCKKNSKQCNWVGFVAVCTSPEEIARLGRRDILIAWRGSVTRFDWIADCMDFLSPAAFGPDHVSSKVRVEKGFLHLYMSKNVNSRYNLKKSARDQVGEAVKHLVGKYKHQGKLSITVTGHSLGSALATLCAYDLAVCQYNLLSGTPNVSDEWHSPESGQEVADHGDHGSSRHPHLSVLKDASLISASHASENIKNHLDLITKPLEKLISGEGQVVNKFPRDRAPVTVYSFGGPRVGNKCFGRSLEALGVAVLRVVNIHDKVPKVPGRVRNKFEKVFTTMPTYKHVGVKLSVDNEKSEYLQKPAGLVRPHNLEGYLHLVDSYHGPGKPYAKTSRDFALVNKSSDYLHRKFAIPPFWMQEKNKGLVRDENGEWRYPDRDETVPMTPPPSVEEEEWKRNVETAEAKSKIAMLQNS